MCKVAMLFEMYVSHNPENKIVFILFLLVFGWINVKYNFLSQIKNKQGSKYIFNPIRQLGPYSTILFRSQMEL
jgi:ABC-type transport system involved in multi-copper enzyme maturation permease subunit